MDPATLAALTGLGGDVLSLPPLPPDYLQSTSGIGPAGIVIGGIGSGAPVNPFAAMFGQSQPDARIIEGVIIALVTAGVVAFVFKRGR